MGLAEREPSRIVRGDTMGDYWNVCNRNRDKLSNLNSERLGLSGLYQCDNRNDDGDS